jgi:hypothetical protein
MAQWFSYFWDKHHDLPYRQTLVGTLGGGYEFQKSKNEDKLKKTIWNPFDFQFCLHACEAGLQIFVIKISRMKIYFA